MSMSPAVELERLSKTFKVRKPRGSSLYARIVSLVAPLIDVVQAIDAVSFRIERGERVAFIGPNGAGKSTTLKILSGILYPDSGRAEVLGLVPWRDRRELGFRAGTVFGQRSQLWFHLPARDTFELLAHVYEVPRKEHERRLSTLVETFELGSLLDKPVRSLSLGERMRCEIAASLLHQPSILFLDEPTIGLDVSGKAAIRDLLKQRSREDGATLLLTSHDTGDIEQVCDRVIVIHRGRVLLDGPVDSLKGRLRTKRVTLITDAETVELQLPGVRVVERRPHHTTFETQIDRTPIGALIQAALRGCTLRDLRVEDPPLDVVIRALYQEAEAERAS